MLRSILVALDDTPGAVAARDAAFALARATGARLTAAVVLDRPHTQSDHEAVPIGGAAFKAHRDARLTAQAEAEAAAALADCAQAAGDLPYATLRLEDAPEPALVKAAASQELIVIGRDSTLGREMAEGGVAPVIEDLLRDGVPPLLVMPPGVALRMEGPVVAAYDGSRPAREALELFGRLGLAAGSPVRVVAVAGSQAKARALAEEGSALLRGQGVAAEPHPLVDDDAAGAILGVEAATGARLLVMGAFGGSSLARMLIGSTTDRLIHQCKVPVFVHGS